MKMPKKALLLAAGMGMRLRPLTLERAKPMMTLWDVPLLERALRLLEAWGVEEVAVNTHWRPELIAAWLRTRGGRMKRTMSQHDPNHFMEYIWYKDKPMRVLVSYEREILGTGGALRPLQKFFGEEPFWMMNADIAASLEPGPLVEAFAENGFASAWLEPKKGPRTVEMDRKGRITCWHSPTPGVEHTYTFCGLQLLSPRIFEFLPETAFSSVVDAYVNAMAQGVFVHGVALPGSYWDDAGTVEAYLRIHGEVKRLAAEGKRGGELYDPNMDRHGADAKTFFCVGRSARVADDVVGVNSVVYGHPTEVLAGSRLTGCVVAGGCVGGVLDGAVCVRPGEVEVTRAVEALGWPADKASSSFYWTRGSERSFWVLWYGGQMAIYIHYSLARAENARYAGHAEVLAAAGVPVPRVLADLPEAPGLVLEHCGADSLQGRMGQRTAQVKARAEGWYRLVIEALVRLHREGTAEVLRRGVELEPCFDAALYAWERGLFEEHLLKARYGFEGLPEDVEAELQAVAGRLLGARQVLVHRDFQSSNVLFRESDERLRGGWPVFIDFQGMRFGAGAYDLASLLYDPYVILDESLRNRLAAYYGECFPENADAVTLLREGAVQRLVQALGAFGRLAGAGQRDFARHIPQALSNVLEVADALELDALGGLAEEMIAREKMRGEKF